MADTLVFDSDKQLKKQRRKRTLIIVLISVLLILAAVAVGYFVKRCAGVTHTGGEDLPFSYTWKQSLDGSALLSVSRDGADGLVWRIADAGEQFGTVNITAAGSKNDSSEFRLSPVEEGRAKEVLTLGNAEGGEGDTYRMELLTEAYREGGRLRCRVLSASCTPLQQIIDVTEGDVTYRIYGNDDGDIVIELPSAAEDWECVSSNEDAARSIGVIFDGETVRAFIHAGEQPGTSEVVLRSEYDGNEIKTEFKLDDEMNLSCTVVKAESFAPAQTPAPELSSAPGTEPPSATPEP